MSHSKTKVGVYAVVLCWLSCAAAWGLIVFYDAESVLVTGPVVILLGLVELVVGGNINVRVLGIGHLALPAILTWLVMSYDWSPSEAVLPFAVVLAGFLFVTTPLTWLAWRQRPAPHGEAGCRHCGESLVGVTDQHCPMCGVAFETAVAGGTRS